MQNILIIDYGMGNIGSMQNMFKRIGVQTEVSAREHRISKADKLVLPGVGAFDAAMARIDELGIRPLLLKRAKVDKIPFIGVCLGMQLLFDKSEEGQLQGLGLMPGRVKKFPTSGGLKVPHMGWSDVERHSPSPLTESLGQDPRFYFVHSYFVEPESSSDVILYATYGTRFAAAVQKGNIFGAQFHPEKSHRFGLALLKCFVEI